MHPGNAGRSHTRDCGRDLAEGPGRLGDLGPEPAELLGPRGGLGPELADLRVEFVLLVQKFEIHLDAGPPSAARATAPPAPPTAPTTPPTARSTAPPTTRRSHCHHARAVDPLAVGDPRRPSDTRPVSRPRRRRVLAAVNAQRRLRRCARRRCASCTCASAIRTSRVDAPIPVGERWMTTGARWRIRGCVETARCRRRGSAPSRGWVLRGGARLECLAARSYPPTPLAG